MIEQVSPPIIILRPPDKLVIEVQSFGEYLNLFWTRGDSNLVANFFHFREVFVEEETSNNSSGTYKVLAPNREVYRLVIKTFHVIMAGMQHFL